MQLVKKKKFWLILLVCLVVLAAVVYGVFRLVTNSLMESEIRDRDPSQMTWTWWEMFCFGMLDLAKRTGLDCTS